MESADLTVVEVGDYCVEPVSLVQESDDLVSGVTDLGQKSIETRTIYGPLFIGPL